MDKISQADLLRKDIAETEALDGMLKDQIEERVIFENKMLEANFKDDIKPRTSKYSIMI